jgi:hypothetical protein
LAPAATEPLPQRVILCIALQRQMGVSRVALLALFAVGTYVCAEVEEDPFDFDAEDEAAADIDESDSGYGQKPIGKDYRGAEAGQIVFEICTS